MVVVSDRGVGGVDLGVDLGVVLGVVRGLRERGMMLIVWITGKAIFQERKKEKEKEEKKKTFLSL